LAGLFGAGWLAASYLMALYAAAAASASQPALSAAERRHS